MRETLSRSVSSNDQIAGKMPTEIWSKRSKNVEWLFRQPLDRFSHFVFNLCYSKHLHIPETAWINFTYCCGKEGVFSHHMAQAELLSFDQPLNLFKMYWKNNHHSGSWDIVNWKFLYPIQPKGPIWTRVTIISAVYWKENPHLQRVRL